MSWLSRVRSGIPFLPKRQGAENLWHKCGKCGSMVFVKEWEENYSVCPRCDFHDRIGPAKRFEQLFDAAEYELLAAPEVRDLVDATDAEAQAAMKKAVEIDALADLELQASEQLNQQLQSAAPGSAAILEAQTAAWLVRANAYTQSAMAELVRVRSIELANHGAQLKFSTAHTVTLHDKTDQFLQSPR